MTIRAAVFATMLLLTTGCITMTRGTKQRVWVLSEPAGAAVTVDGKPAGITPTQVEVTRGDRHEVSITKDSLRVDTVLTRRPTPVLLAYILLGPHGLVPAFIDVLSGAAINVADANVVLKPGTPRDALIAAA